MRIYIAGPMTGIEDYNYPFFFKVAEHLREQGHNVINPAARHDRRDPVVALEKALAEGLSHDEFVRQGLTDMLRADEILMLPGWRESSGARKEFDVSQMLGMPALRLDPEGNLAPLFTIVGISGFAQTGKDTAAEHLIETFGFVKRAFADPLRAILYATNPVIAFNVGGLGRYADSIDTMGYEATKKNSDDARDLLIRLGTEGVRHCLWEDTWVRKALDPYSIPDGGKIVMTDVRFENEANAVLQAGGIMLRVNRPGVGPIRDHPSETELIDYPRFDAVIENDGSLDLLFEKVREALSLELPPPPPPPAIIPAEVD